MGMDYATVHRGVYTRSADMTRAYEQARRTVAALIGGDENELVFTRGPKKDERFRVLGENSLRKLAADGSETKLTCTRLGTSG
jgi:cysteine sulfinate desulfinase/cysteine desulfurase-like protein